MISVIIATYNDQWVTDHRFDIEWSVRSAAQQHDLSTEVVRIHRDTLHEARNEGALKAKGSRLVFLDGDDWLEPDFTQLIVEPEDILQPRTRFWTKATNEFTPPEYIAPRADLLDGNHLIVGCPVNRQLFLDVGGFDDWPIYEDWALWLKMRKAGATFGKTSGVYNIQTQPQGRNAGEYAGTTYDQIRATYA